MIRKESSAHVARRSHDEKGAAKLRPCYFCLEGWVFIGSVGHDGEEYIEAIRCRKCKDTGRAKTL